jgi:hypothetical protein
MYRLTFSPDELLINGSEFYQIGHEQYEYCFLPFIKQSFKSVSRNYGNNWIIGNHFLKNYY